MIDLPPIKNSAKSHDEGITYHVMAYRKLTRDEIIQNVMFYHSQSKKKERKGDVVTIISLEGMSD